MVNNNRMAYMKGRENIRSCQWKIALFLYRKDILWRHERVRYKRRSAVLRKTENHTSSLSFFEG